MHYYSFGIVLSRDLKGQKEANKSNRFFNILNLV